jgi:hypothetical protein
MKVWQMKERCGLLLSPDARKPSRRVTDPRLDRTLKEFGYLSPQAINSCLQLHRRLS